MLQCERYQPWVSACSPGQGKGLTLKLAACLGNEKFAFKHSYFPHVLSHKDKNAVGILLISWKFKSKIPSLSTMPCLLNTSKVLHKMQHMIVSKGNIDDSWLLSPTENITINWTNNLAKPFQQWDHKY